MYIIIYTYIIYKTPHLYKRWGICLKELKISTNKTMGFRLILKKLWDSMGVYVFLWYNLNMSMKWGFLNG